MRTLDMPSSRGDPQATGGQGDRMNAAVKRLIRAGNGLAVFLYRRSNGRIGGSARGGTPVLLLTVPGRKTGTPHTAPVSYFEDQGSYVVTGTAGGRKQDPQWFRNLRAAPRAHVELGPRHLDVDVHVASGVERDRLWREVVLARAPSFATYEEKSGRVIPVAMLTPV
jgi:deazaflavin-dependent oxidoreductase (nitroreductase family)